MNQRNNSFSLLLLLLITFFLVSINSVYAATQAHDSTIEGPHIAASSEYHLPAVADPDILPGTITEIWAKIFYPQDIQSMEDKAPLVVLLHGNHPTCGTGSNPRRDKSCEYTDTGKCPDGYIPVPNHEGYNYIAENLATWGFWVVSINANRGINCGSGVYGDSGLNLARGKLVLKHLNYLYNWATTGDAPATIGLGPQGLVGKIDFTSVGLFGHSRGGEGVRAAYNLYRDTGSKWPDKIPGLAIKAIFEIGAVDGQTSRVLDANDIVWNQLLPLCDGDVSDLQGRYPFERMLLNTKEPSHAQKSLYEVWGANHNYFNTEWQRSDSSGCSVGTPIFDQSQIGSEAQRKIALASVPAFFRSRLGSKNDAIFNQNFNPLDQLPNVVTNITDVDRDFTPSPGASDTLVIDDFDKKTGINSSGNPNLASKINIEHKYLIGSYHPQRIAEISWKEDQDTYFEAVWATSGQGKDIHDFATLDFRVGRYLSATTKIPPTDFSIQLEDATGQFSKEITVSDYVTLNGPGTRREPILETVRIPLSAFQGVNLTAVHGVRFTFNKTNPGRLYLGNIRAHRQMGLGSNASTIKNLTPPSKALRARGVYSFAQTKEPLYVPARLNSMRIVKVAQKNRWLNGKSTVEIIIGSQEPFPATNRLPVLKIGDKTFTLSRYSDLSQLKEMAFIMSEEQYKTLDKNGEVTLSNGKIWQFGTLQQNMNGVK